jgi:MSHA biogenesis protein MshP
MSLNHLKNQKGLGLPSAIFLIVIVIMIVASINQLNEMNAQAFGREWLSQRAFYAADSGAQLAATYALNSSESSPVCNTNYINNLSLSISGLSSCTINVVCDTQDVASETFMTFTSTGQCGSGADLTTRIIQVRLLDD